MVLILLITISLISLVMMFFVKASVFFGILSLVLSVGGNVIWFLRKKLTIPKGAFIGIMILCVAGSVALLLPADNSGKLAGYDELKDSALEKLRKGRIEEAKEYVNRLEKDWQADDRIIYMRVILAVEDGKYEEAYAFVETLSDTSSRLYFTMLEFIHQSNPAEDTTELLYAMYLQAAQNHPDWTYMQKKAGISLACQKNYNGAIYFLERALMQDTEDPENYYYLGIANYHLSNYDSAKSCFAKAIEYELDKKYDSDLLWYIRQMEQED